MRNKKWTDSSPSPLTLQHISLICKATQGTGQAQRWKAVRYQAPSRICHQMRLFENISFKREIWCPCASVYAYTQGISIYSHTCVNSHTHTTATASGPWPWPTGSAIMGDHPATHTKALVIHLLWISLPLGRESSAVELPWKFV